MSETGRSGDRFILRCGLPDFADQSVLFVGPWRDGCIAKQPIKFQSRDIVALAGSLLQSLVIEDADVTAPVPDQPRLLQAPHHIGDRCSPDTEHHSEEFMGKQKIARWHAVARHQQPAATALFDSVKVSAGCRLRDLVEESMGIAEHDQLQCGAAVELAAENAGVDSESCPRNLYVNR